MLPCDSNTVKFLDELLEERSLVHKVEIRVCLAVSLSAIKHKHRTARLVLRLVDEEAIFVRCRVRIVVVKRDLDRFSQIRNKLK